MAIQKWQGLAKGTVGNTIGTELQDTFNEVVDKIELVEINSTLTSPHALIQDDSSKVLVFNDAANVAINIPDGLSIGTAFVAVNVGAGSVEVAMSGTETLRGSGTLANANGYITVFKVSATEYQSSEV